MLGVFNAFVRLGLLRVRKKAITISSSVATSGLSYSPTLPASKADIAATLNSAEINALSTSEIAKLTSR